MSNQNPQATPGVIMMQPQPTPYPSQQNQYAPQPNQYPNQPAQYYPQPAPYPSQPTPYPGNQNPYFLQLNPYAQYPQPQIEYPDFEFKNEPIYATCKACHKSGNTSVRSKVSGMQWCWCILCWMFGWIPCCWVPFCINDCFYLIFLFWK